MSIRGNDNLCQRFEELCSSTSNNSVDSEPFKVSFISGVLVLLQHSDLGIESILHWASIYQRIVRENEYILWNDTCKAIRAELHQLRYPTNGLYDHWLYKKLLIGLKKTYPSLSLSAKDPEYLSVLNFLGWFNRLPICLPPKEVEFSDYLSRDVALDDLSFDNDIAESLHAIAIEWFSDFTLDDEYRPRLSPGCTADAGRTPRAKLLACGTWSKGHLLSGYDYIPKWFSPSASPVPCTAKVQAVPKQLGKNRIICMEPAGLAAHQAGLLRSFMTYLSLSDHPLNQYLNVHDQEVNRNAVRHAQQDGLATIDLSNASDSVSWRLVCKVFRGLPLLRYLYATRSTHYDLDGVIHQARKFAPMGSGVCFLIESIIFALILHLAKINRSCTRTIPHHGWSVYGDDLIVPVDYYQDVTDILEVLGFTINRDKSFFEGPYRESCGVECILDVELEIIRHPRKHLIDPLANVASRHMMLLDLLNSILSHGYYLSWRWLLNKMKSLRLPRGIIRKLGSGTVHSLLLDDCSFIRRNGTLPRCKYQVSYQRTLYHTFCSKNVPDASDDIRYEVWLMAISYHPIRKKRMDRLLGYKSCIPLFKQELDNYGIAISNLDYKSYLVSSWSSIA